MLPTSTSTQKGNTSIISASRLLAVPEGNRTEQCTAPSAPRSSWLLGVLTLSSHRTPPKSECPAVSHTRETGSERAAGVERHHPGRQSPQGSSPLSSASLSCSRTQECHGPGPCRKGGTLGTGARKDSVDATQIPRAVLGSATVGLCEFPDRTSGTVLVWTVA